MIYADNAATTRISEEVLQEMLPFMCDKFGNASSLYSLGAESRTAIKAAREKIAEFLGAEPDEIFFTSGGSESDNWAIRGVGSKKTITSKIEHHAVLHTCQTLAKEGIEVEYVDVDENGFVDLVKLKNSIENGTLVSVMMANNEIGTIEPIAKISEICHEKGAIFHTDAVQAVGHIEVNVRKLGVDLLSFSAHKFHGPKGVGGLYVKKSVQIAPFINGGAQERGKRAGTENVAGIVGMAKALEIACSNMKKNNKKITEMRNVLIENLLKIEYSRLNGDPVMRLPGNVNVCFEGIEGESLLLNLDACGICASSGSACTSASLDPSHVLLAIGLPHEVAHGSLRLTLCDENTPEEIKFIYENVAKIVVKLRLISPLWEKINKREDL
jgi:cysteine desulfurase